MLNNRLKNLERQIHGRPCAACAAAPGCVVIDTPDAQAKFDQQMRKRRAECTCGRRFYVLIIRINRRAVAA